MAPCTTTKGLSWPASTAGRGAAPAGSSGSGSARAAAAKDWGPAYSRPSSLKPSAWLHPTRAHDPQLPGARLLPSPRLRDRRRSLAISRRPLVLPYAPPAELTLPVGTSRPAAITLEGTQRRWWRCSTARSRAKQHLIVRMRRPPDQVPASRERGSGRDVLVALGLADCRRHEPQRRCNRYVPGVSAWAGDGLRGAVARCGCQIPVMAVALAAWARWRVMPNPSSRVRSML
jgi:hypothetical protein